VSVRKYLGFGLSMLAGAVLGFIAAWMIQVQGEKSMAKANLLVAGEALHSGDLVMSMLHAQATIAHAPQTYDGYESVGDVYSEQGNTVGAKRMYELAVQKLSSGGTDALLVQEGANSVSTATQLLQMKIASLQ
jgi:predicted negative regulator of RcsB-dependent stress response